MNNFEIISLLNPVQISKNSSILELKSWIFSMKRSMYNFIEG
jgi:hypothetical protein